MDSLAILGSNLISPPVLAFASGIVAVWARSDLKFPEQVYQALTIYLLIAIGYKGGSAMAAADPASLVLPILATLFVGSIIPISVFFVSRKFLRMDVPNSTAIAAHYGSVSAVTFMASIAFLEYHQQPFERFMPAVMAVMEIPAIFVSFLMARQFGNAVKTSMAESIREVLAGKSFVLLICGLVVGLVSGSKAKEALEPFLVEPFYGVLMLFLLEMGLVAGEKLKDVFKAGWRLIVFALVSPVIQGTLGIFVASAIGLSLGGAVIFAVLCASASYIAATAAVRVSLPEANPGYYITASLGITFPFNLILGIPLYYFLAQIIIT